MTLENGRCEFELEDYCIASAKHPGFKCSAELPIEQGGICGKCGAPDAELMTLEEWEQKRAVQP